VLIIDFIDETEGKGAGAAPLIEQLLTFAAKAEQLEDGTEVSVTFLDDAAIRHINREYRGKDQATDVISFALEEEGEDETPIRGTAGIPRHLGDLLISVETAERQAADYGHSLEREVGFLALHGFLHLLGYDHMNEHEEKKMFGRQDEILAAYGLNR